MFVLLPQAAVGFTTSKKLKRACVEPKVCLCLSPLFPSFFVRFVVGCWGREHIIKFISIQKKATTTISNVPKMHSSSSVSDDAKTASEPKTIPQTDPRLPLEPHPPLTQAQLQQRNSAKQTPPKPSPNNGKASPPQNANTGNSSQKKRRILPFRKEKNKTTPHPPLTGLSPP